MSQLHQNTTLIRSLLNFTRWMFILFPFPGADFEYNPSPEQYIQRVKEFIGDDSIPVRLIDVSKWFVNEIVAEYYSDGNM